MALVRRVFSLSTQQGEWLDAQGARLGISWGEYLRRLIDEKRVPPTVPGGDGAPQLDAGTVAGYVPILAPQTGGAAEAWQTLCAVAAERDGLNRAGTAALLCRVTGKQIGATITLADCAATYAHLVAPVVVEGQAA